MINGIDIEIYPKTGNMIWLGVGSFLFVVLGVVFAIFRVELELNSYIILITSYIGVPFFSLLLIYDLHRLINRKPSLIVNKEGITDNASAVSVGLIKWNDIKYLYIYSYMDQKWIGIVPRDYEELLAHMNPVKRKLIQINKGLVQAPINIPQITVAIPEERIVEYANEYMKNND